MENNNSAENVIELQNSGVPEAQGNSETDVQGTEIEGLVNKNKELLKELKQFKAKAREYETQQEKLNRQKLEEEGKYKELLETERAEKTKLLESVKLARLERLASEMYDPTDIRQFKNLFEFDEDLNILNSQEVIDKLKSDKSYLFKKEEVVIPNTNTGIPQTRSKSGADINSLAKLSREEYFKQREKFFKKY